ncbi:MAG: photosystem I reaction center subunit XII [Cyanobacteria bacterium P01_D01_bin.123]
MAITELQIFGMLGLALVPALVALLLGAALAR